MVSTRRKDRIGAGCLTLFALPFVAVGAIALYFATAGLWTWQRMSGWTPVPADLERVELEHHRGDNSTTYRVVARYRYRYGGREYVGDRVAINSFSDNIGDFHERLYRQLQGARSRGEPVVAYVDPVDPVNATLNRDPRWLLTGFMTVFGLAFGIAGVGLLVGSRLSARRLTELRQLKERFPKQPWRWRKDWSEARVKASSRSTAYLAIGFATLWNLISLPVAVAVPAEAEKGNWSALVALLFPAIGIGLAIWAIRSWLRLRRYGVSTLILETVPVALGGRLRGTVKVDAGVPVDDAFKLKIGCVERRQSRNRKNSSERILWQDERIVARDRCQLTPSHSAIPIDIRLPGDQPPSSMPDANRRFVWRLELAGECPGPDYLGRFEVPVFDTGLDGIASPERGEQSVDARPAAGEPDPRKLASAGIVYERLPDGKEAWTFKRARHKSAALGLTAFMLVWTAITVFLGFSDASVLFPVLFGLFDCLLVWAALGLWFAEYRVTLGKRGLTILKRGLGFGKRVDIPRQRIERIHAERGMQAGNKLYYDLRVQTHDGHNYTAARTLGDYSIARWLADYLMMGGSGRAHAPA